MIVKYWDKQNRRFTDHQFATRLPNFERANQEKSGCLTPKSQAKYCGECASWHVQIETYDEAAAGV